METVYAALSLSAVITSSFLISRVLKPSGAVEFTLFYFTSFTGQVIASGYFLSSTGDLDKLSRWSLLSVFGLFAVLALVLLNGGFSRICLRRVRRPNISALKIWCSQLSLFEKILLFPPLATVVLLGLVNLGVVLFSAPHNVDSMTFHLPRVAYYIQHGNLNYYHAGYWCQVVHPKNSTLLTLYTYLVTGRNENMTQMVQFISYWIAIFSVYGISRRIGNNVVSSLFSSSVFALLIECLMQSVTTQNDMLIAAYVGVVAYLFFAFRETRERKYLVVAGVNVGLVIGVKASALLAFPSLLALGIYVLHARPWTSVTPMIRNSAVFLTSSFLAILVFALPSGYLENYARFGHPIFPESVRSTVSFEGESVGYIMKNGSKNALRYAFDFLSFDGLPPVEGIREMQSLMRKFPAKVVRSLGIDLETTEAVRGGFYYEEGPLSHEDVSYWGIFGFGLIWIVVFLLAVGIVKSPAGRALSIAAILFLLVESYAGFYDPWRGRRFMIAAIFSTSAIGCCLTSRPNKAFGAYLVVIVFLGCLSAWTAVLFRVNSPVLPVRYKTDPLIERSKASIFSMDRLGQLTRNKPQYYEPLKRYEELTPEDAVVAVCLPGGSYEYPLFGKGLTRTIIPICSYYDGFQPIPQNAQYLLYSREYISFDTTDIHLGEGWYLRKLGAHGNTSEAAVSSCVTLEPQQIGIFRDGLWFLDADGNHEWADGFIELFRFCVAHDKKDELVCLSFDYHFTSHNQHLLAENLLEY